MDTDANLKVTVARWETRGRRYWYELHRNRYGYSYRGDNCGGIFPADFTINQAIADMEKKIQLAKAVDSITYRRVM